MPRTILLADDSVTVRKVVELTFCDTDIRVEAVATGSEAVTRFHDLAPDLVLADVVMPEPTGYEICRTVKASPRPVPVLLLAGTFEPFDPERARSCGADGHLVKPFDSRTLLDRVEALLERAGTEGPMHEPPPAPPAVEIEAASPADAHLEALLEDLDREAPPSEAPRSDAPAPEPPTEAGVSPAPEPPPAPPTPVLRETSAEPNVAGRLSDADVERVARRVVELLADSVLREIAWDVVPELAEVLVRERLRELEHEETEAN